MNIEIYQTFHRPFPYKKCDWIKPVGVGGYHEPGFLKDNTGDNIAHLNPYYSEFTTMYWVWKNVQLPDAVGFYHYRRYLHIDHHDRNFKWGGKIDKGSHYQVDYIEQPHVMELLTSDHYKEKITSMLQSTDAITGYPMRFDVTVPQQWAQHHPMEPLIAFVDELKQQYPHNHRQINYFFSQYGRCTWPVMIMKKDLFLRFCETLFPLLDRIFKKIGTPYNSYQNRYLCFLVERFIPVFFHLNNVHPNWVPTMTLYTPEVPLDGGQRPNGNGVRKTVVQHGF